jgi:hypothetical protein
LLDLKVFVEIHPLLTVSCWQAKVPGLTGPIPLQFREVAAWENLSRDPLSGEFFVNQ